MTRSTVIVLLVFISALAAHSAQAQRRIIGKVTSSLGPPVLGADIKVQGTTLGTTAAEDGTFSLRIPDGPQVLAVRSLGYRRATVAVPQTTSEVNVMLVKDALELDKMVITGTVTRISSANSANSVGHVSGEELTKAPSATIEEALQGKIPGVVITTNSGAPGGGAQMQIRGTTSINGSSTPLYVVDGVIVSNVAISTGLHAITNAGGPLQDQQVNRIADLNPEDIEKIEVLKGASAGAIYGSKASNGVIIITTRRGINGKPRFRVEQSVGRFNISRKLGLRCFKSAEEALDWWQNTAGGDGEPPIAWQPNCHDFERELYGDNKLSYQTEVSVAGGAGSTTYYVGGSVKRDNAIQRNTYFDRKSLTANIDQRIGDRLTVRLGTLFTHSLTDRGISGNDNSPVVSPGDVFAFTPTWYDMAGKIDGQYAPNLFLTEQTNVFQDADEVTNPEEVNRYVGSANANLLAYSSQRQSLNFTLIAGVDAISDQGRLFMPPNVFVAQASGLPGTVVASNASVLSSNINFSGAHQLVARTFTGTTSFGIRREHFRSDQILNEGHDIPDVSNVNFGAQRSVSERKVRIEDLSYYAQEELLVLNERMLLTAAMNLERSSVNGDDKKLYNYPKAAMSFRLPGFPRRTDEIKLRAAWGQAGNQPPFGFKFTTLSTGTYDAILGAVPSAIAGNPDIRPETSTETEGGIDATLFNRRLAFSATVFRKNVKDLVLSASVSPTTGFNTQFVNGGTLRNTGSEYELAVTPIQTRALEWVSHTTLATIRNMVTSLTVPCFFVTATSFGRRFGGPYVCNGYSISTLQAFNGWDTTFVDGTFQSRTRHIQNYESAPKFTMGFSNDVTWNRWRFHGLVDLRKGGHLVDVTTWIYDNNRTLADTSLSDRRLGAWLDGYASYVQPAGFVKLREISLSYALPKTLTGRIFASSACDTRLEVSGRNLKMWSSYKGYDPEVSNFSNVNIGRFQDVMPYPPSRSIFFAVKASC
jgi:TonB-dependent starch-binding outer membrane protein SusC